MKNSNFIRYIFVIVFTASLTSCEVIGAIFKTGVGIGIFVTVAVLIIIGIIVGVVKGKGK